MFYCDTTDTKSKNIIKIIKNNWCFNKFLIWFQPFLVNNYKLCNKNNSNFTAHIKCFIDGLFCGVYP